jgi:hypothetical protein
MVQDYINGYVEIITQMDFRLYVLTATAERVRAARSSYYSF